MASADADTDGVSVEPVGGNLIQLVGGATLTAADGGRATRTHAGLAANANHKADGSKRDNTRPTVSTRTLDGDTLTITLNKELREYTVPDKRRFTVKAGGTAQTIDSVAVSGKTVTLTLASSIKSGTAVTLSYDAGTGIGNFLLDLAGNSPSAFTDQTVNTGTDLPPAVDSATVNGTSLVIDFDEAPNGSHVPAAARFDVTVDGQALAASAITNVAISGRKVTLTLASGSSVAAGSTVLVGYSRLAGQTALQDAAGNLVKDFLWPATNALTDKVPPKVVSGTASGRTVALTFDKALKTPASTASLRYAFFLSRRGHENHHPDGVSVSGKVVTLTFAEALAIKPDEKFYVHYDPRLAAEGERLVHEHGLAEVALFADYEVTNSTAGGTGGPALVLDQEPGVARLFARGTGQTSLIRITLSEALDPASAPAGSAFEVRVSDPESAKTTTIAGTGTARISGSEVEVTLASGVEDNAIAEVRYTKPATNPLQDLEGNDANDFSTNRVEVVDEQPPVIQSQTTLMSNLWLVYDQALDEGSVPPVSDFTVRNVSRGRDVTVRGVTVAGNVVKLSLPGPIPTGQQATVSYTAGTTTIRDPAGNDAANLASFALTQPSGIKPGTPTLVAKNEGADPPVYPAVADGARVTLTYTQLLDPTSVPDRSAFTFSGGAFPPIYRVQIVSKEVELALIGPVHPCERFTVAYTKPAENPLRNAWIQDANAFAATDVTNNRASKCLQRFPAGGGLTANAESLSMDLGRTLGAESEAEGAHFTVRATPPGGAARTVRGTGAAEIDGRTVRVTLDSPLRGGETATVSYARPAGAIGLWDTDGNQIADFSDRAVTNATPAPEPTNSAATGAPTIAGEARVGETLTASTDGIADADGLTTASFNHQWLADDEEIAGATADSLVLDAAQEGAAVAVRVSFDDDAGNPESLTSAATAAVAARPNQPATGAPAITGTAQAGETLTASTADIDDADGLSGAAFAYEWLSNDAEIEGARDASLTLDDAQVSRTVKVRVSFTDDAGNEETLTSSATEEVKARPLTAEFSGVPDEHDGETAFEFELRFSDDFPGRLRYKVLRDEALQATNGRVTGARRASQGQNQRWIITVRPNGVEDVTVTLPAGSVRTDAGRELANTTSATVTGPVGISVADARVEEGAGAVLAFAVTLSRAATSALTVDYATSDGSALAGEDYTAASGTLSLQAGETSGTVEVAVLDDAHDEGEETLTLRLSNASGGVVTDGEATGTIENADLMPAALLARFGRATAEQVVTHIEERMAAPRQRGFRARFAGREFQPGSERDFALGFLSSFAQPMGMGPAGAVPIHGAAMGGGTPMGMGSHTGAAGASMTGAMSMTGVSGMGGMGGNTSAMGIAGQQPPMGHGSVGGAHEPDLFSTMVGHDPLSNSEFELNREARGGTLSLWSRNSRSHFSGMDDALSLNGDVRTSMFGADYARGPLTLGLSVGRTLGLGGYSGPSSGQMTTSMTGFYPWVGYQVNDKVSVWGVTGYGTGMLSLTPGSAAALETGVSMAMSAVGTRGELIGSRATGGFALAFKSDALWVGAASELLDGPTGRLNASEAGVTRVRSALEGSRGFTIGGGRLSLRPSVEVGLRRDGGDAETGAGMDVGGGLAFTDTVTGLSLDVRVRTLVVHQADGFSDRGMSLSFGWDPTPSSPLGLTARVAPSWGGQARGGAEALWGNQMAYGMGSHQMHGAGERVDAEVGYGLPVGARFVGTPKVGVSTAAYGRDYRVGYGLGVLEQGKVNFELAAEAQRRETPMQGEASNGLLGRATIGW